MAVRGAPPLALTQQAGVEGAGGLRGAPPDHTFQLLQGVQDHVGGVFGRTLSLQLPQLVQGRAHGRVYVLERDRRSEHGGLQGLWRPTGSTGALGDYGIYRGSGGLQGDYGVYRGSGGLRDLQGLWRTTVSTEE